MVDKKTHLIIWLELQFKDTNSNLKIANNIFKKTNQKLFSDSCIFYRIEYPGEKKISTLGIALTYINMFRIKLGNQYFLMFKVRKMLQLHTHQWGFQYCEGLFSEILQKEHFWPNW